VEVDGGRSKDESPPALLPTLMASADVILFLKALLKHVCLRPAPLAEVPPCYVCLLVLQLTLRIGVSNPSVATVVWFFAADAWLLALSDGCFAVTAPMVDTLPPTSLRSPHLGRYFAAKCMMAPLPRILCR
jgi:hypothetical protein